ncbi:MAG: hypothetical protein QOG42_842 [Solirubrobacteraceae bacterium]|nr:hypothetical protein [Solirubrobacteraceae bacterium]
MTHAIVLVEAERDVMSTLGGSLAEVDGVREAYSVTGEWDFVCIVHVKQHEDLASVVTSQISSMHGVARTHTMVAFEAFSRHDLEKMFSIGGLRSAAPARTLRLRQSSCQPRANHTERSFQSCAMSAMPTAPQNVRIMPVAP